MKSYNDEEIDALVEEIKEQYLAPLMAEAAQEVVAKAEGKKAPITGGSGLAIKKETLGDEMSAKAKSNKFTNFPVSKEESSMSKESSSSSASSMSKDEGTASAVPPTMKEQSGGKQPLDAIPPTMKPLGKEEGSSPKEASSSSDSGSGEGSGGHDSAPDMGSDAPPMADAPAPAPAAPADPAMQAQGGDQGGDMQSLQNAYCQLSPEEKQMHLMALQAALQQDMGAQMGQPAAAPMAPAPQEKALMMSEKQSHDLAKAEEKIETLEKTLESVVGLFEGLLRGQPKSVRTMAEYVAKSEQDSSKSVSKLSKSEVNQKLTTAARDPKLSKSDGQLISRYFLSQDVELAELEHLLK